MAAVLGFKDVIDLYYRAHRMNEISPTEIRGRLILLLRMLKADTVISFHPSEPGGRGSRPRGHRPCSGRRLRDGGQRERFSRTSGSRVRGPSPYANDITSTRIPISRSTGVVDIGPHVEKKIDAIVECQSQGGGRGS